MISPFFEKDADSIYEDYQSTVEESVEQQEEEYREDRMEQMISRHGY
jgi:trehalose-6-phosphatase